MKNVYYYLLVAFLFTHILSGCSGYGNLLLIEPTLTSVPSITLRPTKSEKATLTLTPTGTPTLTRTPTLTSTSTITPTITPAYTGGALILFTAVDEEGIWHCGVASADGYILIENAISSFDGISIYSEEGTFNPPRYCAPGSQLVDWSPDFQQFIFSVFSTQESIYRLFVGSMSSDQYFPLTSFPLGTIDKIEWFFQSQSRNERNPLVRWLDTQRIWLENYVGNDSIINIATQKQSILGYSVRQISPDSKYFAYQRGSVYLAQFDGDTTIDLSLLAESNGIESTAWPVWAPDSRKFALFGKRGNTYIYLIFDVNGNLMSTVDQPRNFNWSPDGNQMLFDCNVQRAGQSEIKEMCLYDLKGDLIKTFPWQSYRISNGNFSKDGKHIYYLLSDAPPAIGLNKFSAILVRLEIETGKNFVVGENLNDFSWIQTDMFSEVYKTDYQTASAVDESPDGNYLLLNNAGSLFGNKTPKLVHSVICNEGSGCADLKFGGFNVIGAAWWMPPPGWKPIEINNQLSLKDESE